MKIIFKPKLTINSIDELNQNEQFTALVWPETYNDNGITVSDFKNLSQ